MYALTRLTNLLPERFRDRAKAIYPALGAAAAVGAQWISTGAFDKAELATALTAGIMALVTYTVPNAPKV